MGNYLVIIIRVLVQVFSFLIIADAILSFVLSPFNPIREAMGRILNPLYAPIRRMLPSAGGFDFSPIVLLLLVQVLGSILIRLFGGL
jgi:YggT family protein